MKRLYLKKVYSENKNSRFPNLIIIGLVATKVFGKIYNFFSLTNERLAIK